MTTTTPLRTIARSGRRLARRTTSSRRLDRTQVTGQAPTAVINSLREAIHDRRTPTERQCHQRIEALRALLLTDPATFTSDLGDIRTIGKMTRSSKRPEWARLLFFLVRDLQPKTVLELGSCVGISAAYQATALQLNGDGRLITLEGVQALADRSQRTLAELGLTDYAEVWEGWFSDTLDPALADLGQVDLAFIDGHHLEGPTLDYAEKVLAAASSEAVLVFDDINWSTGMAAAWQAIRDDPRYALIVDMRTVGIAVVSATATSRHTLTIG